MENRNQTAKQFPGLCIWDLCNSWSTSFLSKEASISFRPPFCGSNCDVLFPQKVGSERHFVGSPPSLSRVPNFPSLLPAHVQEQKAWRRGGCTWTDTSFKILCLGKRKLWRIKDFVQDFHHLHLQKYLRALILKFQNVDFLGIYYVFLFVLQWKQMQRNLILFLFEVHIQWCSEMTPGAALGNYFWWAGGDHMAWSNPQYPGRVFARQKCLTQCTIAQAPAKEFLSLIWDSNRTAI